MVDRFHVRPEDSDYDLVEVIVTCSHFGYNAKIFSRGETLLVTRRAEKENVGIIKLEGYYGS
jgi:hypothetical protein